MAYSQIYLKSQHKIPTVFGILILIFILFFFIRIFYHDSIPSRASKKIIPRMEIANLSSNQVTIYWQGDNQEIGWVIVGEKDKELTKIVLDERDIQTKKNSYRNHYVVLRDLHENTTYFFKLVNDNQLVGKPNGESFSFVTPRSFSSVKAIEPAYGKVISPNNTPLENAIILIRINKAYPLVALTKSTGEWLVPLSSIYETDTLKSRTLGLEEALSIEVIGENGQQSTITTNTAKISPLPQTIILGKNYDFLNGAKVLGASDNQEGITTHADIDIVYPTENKLIPGYRPLIKGVALPNEQVIVTIQGATNLAMRVTADEKGMWKTVLASNLSPGDYTIMLSANNKQGLPETVKRKFIIAKNGEQVLGVATAEPTLTEQPATPIPIPTSAGTATPKPPVSGSTQTTPLVGGASLIIMGLGLLLVF